MVLFRRPDLIVSFERKHRAEIYAYFGPLRVVAI